MAIGNPLVQRSGGATVVFPTIATTTPDGLMVRAGKPVVIADEIGTREAATPSPQPSPTGRGGSQRQVQSLIEAGAFNYVNSGGWEDLRFEIRDLREVMNERDTKGEYFLLKSEVLNRKTRGQEA